jgi:hypothetical protein
MRGGTMKQHTFGRTERPLGMRDCLKLHQLCRACGGWGFVVERFGNGKWRCGYFIAESVDANYDADMAKRVLRGANDLRIEL